jgi:hypothetical protein
VGIAQALFISAAALMFIDAVGYSLGALPPLHRALAPGDRYLNRRVLLNLMLANAGLYFTSIYTFVGAYLAGIAPHAAFIVMAVSLVVCLYSAVTIPLLTPRDWKHVILRGVAGMLILFGLVRG